MRMKIAILFQGDLEKVSIGGIAEYVRNLIRFSGDNEITLFGVCHSGDYQIGVPVHKYLQDVGYLFLPLCDDSKKPLSFWYTLALRASRARLADFDVIYAQRPEYCLAFKTNELDGRLFQIIHGSSAYTVRPFNSLVKKMYLEIERGSIRKCTRTLIIMKREDVGLEYYRRLYPDMADKFLYGRIPVDTSVFHSCNQLTSCEFKSIDSNRFVITYSGRVEDYPKRVLLFPKIVDRIRDINPLFVIVGDGASIGDLQTEIINHNLEDNFLLMGYCSDRHKLATIIEKADLTINLSCFEGTCTSSLESVACGTPVLSTDVGEIRTIVFDGKNGYVIPNGSDHQIVEDAVGAIRTAFNNPIQMTDDYLAYSCERAVPELFQLFEELIGDKFYDA